MRAITFACLSFVTASLALEFSDLLTLDKRQDIAPGTPLYECHAHCGGVIVDAEATGYCTNSTYETDLSDCLECAMTQDIWQYYGSSVQSAASACGDNATPSTSSVVSGSASATTSAAITTTASSNVAPETITSSMATSAIATSSTATSAETTSSAASAASATASSASAAISSSTSTAAASTFTGAAARVGYETPIFLAAAGAVVHGLLL